MKKSQNNLTDAEILRQKAEEQLKKQQPKVSSLSSENDLRKLTHELQVHQIELEMQYEQLKKSKEESDAATQKYTELYDFAPSGYFTLTKPGEIIELNLHGARLLGKERLHLINRRFGSSVSDDTKPIFNHFLDKVFTSKGNQSCELTLSVESKNIPTYVYLTGHVLENGEQCRISVVDITERKKMEEELVLKNNSLSKLNRFALELSNLSSDVNLEAFITKQVKEFASAEFAVFSEYNSLTRTTTTKQIEMESGLLEKVVGLLGKQVQDIHSVVSTEMYREMTTEMIGIKKTLYEASFGAVPRSVGAAIQALLKVDRIIGIAYLIEGRLYGTSVLAMKKGQPDPPKEIFENFVHLAASSLRREKAEEALKESEERFRSLYENNTIGIYRTTPDGKIILANPTLVKLLGYSSFEKLSERNLEKDGFEPSYERTHFMDVMKRDGEVKGLESAWTRMDGTALFVSESARAINDKEGKIIYYDGTVEDIIERKRAEEALKASETKYHAIFDNVQDVFYQTNLDGTVLEVSPSIENILGFSRDEIIGKPIAKLSFDFKSKDMFFYKLKENGELRDYELCLKTKTGEFKYTSINAQLIFDSDGKPNHIDGAIRDITQRKQAELKQKQSEEFTNRIIESSQDCIKVLDLKGNLLSMSNSGQKLLEIDDITIYLNKSWVDFWKGKDREDAREAILKAKKGDNGIFIGYSPTEKGTPKWWEVIISPIKDPDGNITNLLAVSHDITERKQAELELIKANKEKEKRAAELVIANEVIMQSEKNFHRSISKSPLGIRIVSVDGETIYANKAFLAIFEIKSLEEFTSIPAINRYTPESYAQHQKRKEKRKNGHDVLDYEISIVSKNEGIRHIKIWRREIIWNGTKHYQIINIDITEQKKLTTDLIAAKEKAEESDRLKSAFLTNMSHEIRTPMNGILGFTELLKEPNLSTDEQNSYIELIEKSGQRLLNTINSIIDISKIESGLVKVNIQKTNINAEMEFTYQFFKPEVESKGIQFFLKCGLPDKEAYINIDQGKINSILTNLVENAIKFTLKGSIELGYVLKSDSEPAELEFHVKDTGIGIPKDRQDAIFDRFIKADIEEKQAFQGSGLGLAISKSYVEMLGGKMWIESQEGLGSVFYFTIPYNAIEEENTEVLNAVPAADNEVKIKNLKILIVEDEEISKMLLEIMVNTFSKQIIKARTGVEAIEACRNHPDIDLVLMDIQLPVMDGYEATRQIREFNKEVVIIAQTAYGLSGDREKAIEAGCNDYIAKPINKTLLIDLIKKHVNK